MIYFFVYHMSRLISWILFPAKVKGLEHLPNSGGYILACNHISFLDPMLVGLIMPRQISFVARDSLFSVPVLGWLIKNLNAFPIKRDTADIRSLRESIRRLKAGSPLLIFPQGSRENVKGQDRLYTGVGFLVAKCRVPVVPVYVSGTDKALPPGSKFPRRHPVSITFGEPLTYSSQQKYDDIAQSIMTNIRSLALDQ